MIKDYFHHTPLVAKIVTSVLQIDPKRFSVALKQMSTLIEANATGPIPDLEIVQQHRGIGYLPFTVGTKVEGEPLSLTKIYIENKNGTQKEFQIHMLGEHVVAIEIKDSLWNLNIESIDSSSMEEEKPERSKYFIREVDLEGNFDDEPELINYVDVEYVSKEYSIDGLTLFRIIQFDKNRCICMDEDFKVYKVNLKVPTVQLKFKSIKDFLIELKSNENYVYSLFGEHL